MREPLIYPEFDLAFSFFLLVYLLRRYSILLTYMYIELKRCIIVFLKIVWDPESACFIQSSTVCTSSWFIYTVYIYDMIFVFSLLMDVHHSFLTQKC